MSVMWLWMLLGLLIPVFAVALWRLWRPAKRRPHFVGDTNSAARLPSYAREQKRARRLTMLTTVILGLLITTLAVIAARPQQQIRKIESQNSRDIVLCMDISGSMEVYIKPALDTLLKIVAANPTDRYSLVLFGNVPYVALPLTNDTTAIDLTVKDLSAQLTDDKLNAADLAGFDPTIEGGTDIGAGLASCFRRFDNIEQTRSRHIIMVSDMEHNGINDPSDFATLLPKYDIKLYILAPKLNVPDIQKDSLATITGATIDSLEIDGSNADATLSAIYDTILTERKIDTYALVDIPYPFWIAAITLTTAWAVTLVIRWRRL